MNLCFATIVSPNYLAYARVLRDSLAVHAPGSEFRVLVVSRPEPRLEEAVAGAALDVVYATELGLPDFEHIAYKFDLVELNTTLKPTFLKSLLRDGFGRVVYLDPDICLYGAPEPVYQALDEAEIVLTPHSLAPAMDGLRPSDIDFLRAGSFNLGFIGLRRGPQSTAMLAWWERRCLSHGFNDPGFGTFVDQKWLDLAPCYFGSVGILKHPGCNTAYWNLHERSVRGSDGAYSVNGLPLVFFHFSGIDASAPQLLSRHQNRHAPIPGSPVALLLADYCARLWAAGHAAASTLPYSFAVLDDGTPITSTMRRAACVEGMDVRQPFSSSSPLQRTLRTAREPPGQSRTDPATVTTLNFDPSDRRVACVNFFVRVLARIVGAERVGVLLRYATFLGWESNFASVLLNRPFELRHVDKRKG